MPAAVRGLVFDIKRFSLHDGPGIRTTVFLKGCPLRCWWCHNPESQSAKPERIYWAGRCIGCRACLEACPEGAISEQDGHLRTDDDRCTLCGRCVEVCYAGAREIVGRERTVAQVMAALERDMPFYDQSGGGVTFSGGEPLFQPAFLKGLLRACRERGIHSALDTCGYAPWEVVDRLREWVDLFLYDLKLVDDERHRRVTGASNAPILHNLQALSRLGHRIVLRVPIVPGLNDDQANLEGLGALAAGLPALERVDLLPYHHIAVEKYARFGRSYELTGLRQPTGEQLEELAALLRRCGLEVAIQE